MKRKNLELLRENGFNVPEFDVVLWEDKDKQIDIKKYKGKYAIRSSSYLEDGTVNSFAGQFDTYLNVKPSNINKKVKDCFNSVNNKNIIDYLKKKKIRKSNLKMDVIIQKMVESEYSGILFTSNPQGLLNETVIVIGKGLGNKIVEDKVDTTTYYYNNTDKIYYYEGSKDYLSKEKIEELIKLSLKIKKVLGNYLDIEFAIKKNKIYILQARPITTLKGNKLVILDNSNIVESYPGISLPLTISFVKEVYSNIFRELCYHLTKNKKIIKDNNDYFNNMVGDSNGRLYYKITNWYVLLKTLPFSKKIIPIWQEMLGVSNKEYEQITINISIYTKIKTYINLIKLFLTINRRMNKLNDKFNIIYDDFYVKYNKNMPNKEIIEIYLKIKEDILSIWDITLINDLYAFIFTGLLKKRLIKKNLSEDIINDYISGITNIESLKPIKSLINLAYKKDNLSKSEYNILFNEYISLYGDRNLEELKLESETFRTNPKLLTNRVKEYRKDKKKLKKLYEDINKEKDITIKKDIITNFLVKRALKGIKNREISRLNRTRIYGMVREMFLTIGSNYVKEKRVVKQRDIFYLTTDEILEDKKYDLKKLINMRKKNYKLYEELPNYTRLVFLGKEFDKQHKSINKKKFIISKDILSGIPCSKGIVEGYAEVINDVNKKVDVNDKILITKMTDPGWVFLLAMAKGVISEKGSLLSHTAIISREIKIPSIVGVNNVTSIIRSGDYIRMDANKGIIEILERK